MRVLKRMMGIVLAFVVFVAGLPEQFMSFGVIPYARAEGDTPAVDIRYDDFSSIENLQFNGGALVKENTIQFESNGENGGSVFTNDKLALGEDQSFSTAFSFRYNSPSDPVGGTKGGFTFTLRQGGESGDVGESGSGSAPRGISINFLIEYSKSEVAARLLRVTEELDIVEMSDLILLEEPRIRCEITAELFVNGEYCDGLIDGEYDLDEELSDPYTVWIGYEETEEGNILRILCLTPSGKYIVHNAAIDLSEALSGEVYAGFMEAWGDSGTISNISNWYFRDDMNIYDKAIVDHDAELLSKELYGYATSPTADLSSFPRCEILGNPIVWDTGDVELFDKDGNVISPSWGEDPRVVTMSATLSRGDEARTIGPYTISIRVPDSEVAKDDADWLTYELILAENKSPGNVVSDLFLPTEGPKGSRMEWNIMYDFGSANTDVIDPTGKVKRPSYSEGNVNVTLTASVTMNNNTYGPQFYVTVLALGMSEYENVEADRAWLTYSQLLNGNLDHDKITGNISLPTAGKYGSTISWSSSNSDIINTNGTVKRPSIAAGDKLVELTATITYNGATTTKLFEFIVKAEISEEERLILDADSLTWDTIKVANTSKDEIIGILYLPTSGMRGSTISWSSSKPKIIKIIDDYGYVIRPTYTEGDQIVTLTATLSIGSFTRTTDFTVKVIKLAPSNEERLAADKELLTDIIILKNNTALTNITGDLNLPTAGTNGSTIRWSSSNANIIKPDGTVTRPTYTEEDTEVTLTATLSIGALTETKEFTVRVIKNYQTDAEKLAADEEWLSDLILKDNTGLNNITGDLRLPTDGDNGSAISWSSSNTDIIKTNGAVTRPTYTEGDQEVILTATLSIGSLTQTKEFPLLVIKLDQTDAERLAADEAWLTDAVILHDNTSLDNITGDLTLPYAGKNGSTITWTSDSNVISGSGIVSRPAYYEEDITVELTATLTKGASVTKTFHVTVKARQATDNDAVSATGAWLPDYVLDKNSGLDNVVHNLKLPTEGLYGAAILWSSTSHLVSSDGVVTRPSYTEEDQKVTLYAYITRGSAQVEMTIEVTVKCLDQTAREQVDADANWLTDDVIRKENSALNNITGDVHLPAFGENGSSITWVSSDPAIVAENGTVTRPSYTQGNKRVTITATITAGEDATSVKSFMLFVNALDITDSEAASLDRDWLSRHNTLGANPSKNSVTRNLSFPSTGPKLSTITWVSNEPSVISGNGTVTRPKNGKGHKSVSVTATITRGDKSYTIVYDYVVLEMPDTSAPEVESTNPGQGEKVLWDTTVISLTYNETIKVRPAAAGLLAYGIELRGGERSVRINVQIRDKTLEITSFAELSTGMNTLVIPAGTFQDAAGNPSAEYALTFDVEARPPRTISIISTTPGDLARDVGITDPITVKFDAKNLTIDRSKYGVFARDQSGLEFLLGGSLSGDTLTINPTGNLLSGAVYELIIPAGLVTDPYGNGNEEKIIQFRTTYLYTNPRLVTTKPANGQTGVSVNQTDLYITLTHQVYSSIRGIRLADNKGNNYAVSVSYDKGDASGVTYRVTPYSLREFEPDTEYILTGPFSPSDDPTQLEFSIRFTTSESKLKLSNYSPSNKQSGVLADAAVVLQFNAPVSRGAAHSEIAFTDSKGKAVAYRVEKIENGEKLIPVSRLSSFTTYHVTIPAGAYLSEEDDEFTPFQFSFTTARLLDIGLSNLSIPNRGFVNKLFFFTSGTAETIARLEGYRIDSFLWRIDGEEVSTKNFVYHTFKSAGDHSLELIMKDNLGNSYTFHETIEIEELSDISMTLVSHDDTPETIIANSDGTVLGRYQYQLKLEQDGLIVTGEEISVALYKHGLKQRTYPKLKEDTKNQLYTFEFKPQYGDFGASELEFTYNGPNGLQTLRVPVFIFSQEPLYANEFRFRLYDNSIWDKSKAYFEGADWLEVTLNGEKMIAYKKWYEDKKYYAYAITDQQIIANTYYPIEINSWNSSMLGKTVFVGKDGSEPPVIYGSAIRPGFVYSSVNNAESTLKEPFTCLFFEGISAELALNVTVNWEGSGAGGYYEFKTKEDRSVQKVKSNGTGEQVIKLDPGLQLKAGETLMVRAVNKYGIASGWNYCPNINVATQPSLMGKKIAVSVQGDAYAISWPTVFDGLIGVEIDALDGVPVIGGGNFGIGNGMPTSSGILDGNYSDPDITLSFGYVKGVGVEKRKTVNPKPKKVKKVTVIGYDFELEVEGEYSLYYSSEDKKWKSGDYYVLIVGDLAKTWSREYKKLGVGFEAGVGVGGKVSAMLQYDYFSQDTKYRGYLGFEPYAFLYVDGDFVIAAVKGYLEASLPAYIHFPSMYMSVELNVDLDITARALLWEKTLYDKRLAHFRWDNSKSKMLMMSAPDLAAELSGADDAELTLLPREYLGRASVWLGGENAGLLSALDLADNPEIRSIMENIYPETEPIFVVNSDEKWLLWTDDNPERDAVNRTQMRYSVQKDGAWQKPVWIDDDGTADFTPAVAAVENGVLMAWHNISKTITEEEGLDEMLKHSEISVTEGVLTAEGGAPNIIRLTDDESIDHSPVLASNESEALLVWIKSEDMGLSMVEDAEEDETEGLAEKQGSQLYYSEWSGGTWSEPSPIGDNKAAVLNVSLTMADETANAEQALLVYTLDPDNDLNTSEDQEVFARVYDGNAWSEPIRLSNNSVIDFAPKAVYVDGQWFITWLQEGKVCYRMGLNGETETAEFSQAVQGDYQLVAHAGDRPLVAIVFSQPGENKAKGISAAFYDVAFGQWGNDVILVSPQEYAGAMNAAFDAAGNLNVAYTEAKLITEAVPDDNGDLAERTAISDIVALKLLSYTPFHDVALSDEEGMFLSTEFPLPETVTTVYVTLRNEGDFSENAAVRLYDGNPKDGGTLVAKTEPQPVPAHSSVEVEIEWLVAPGERDGYHLYAVASTVEDVQETDHGNNTIDLAFLSADVTIAALNYENLFEDHYLVRATIANSGGRVLEGVTVQLKQNDLVLESQSIERMELGQKTAIEFMVVTGELVKDKDDYVNLTICVLPPDGVQEEFTDNNARSFTLIPAAIAIESINPGPGDKQVDPATTLTLTFNMNIGEGIGYRRIKLIDEFLNEVAVSKSIDGNALTITPTETLEYGTEYTLLIPDDALGDSYGHSLTADITCSFTTMTTNPEVVFAYPGESMEDAELNTEIRLKYNQVMHKGPYFSEISIYGEDNREISASADINGEFLTFRYSGKLEEGTTYTVQVPVGAVQNDRGESQDEDYLLRFTTIGADDGDDDGGYIYIPSDQQYQASISINGTEKKVKVSSKGGNAVVDLGDLAGEVFAENQHTVVNIPSIPNVGSFTMEMPAEVLATSGTSSMTVNTPWGSVTIPSGMLRDMQGINGRTAGISIGIGEASELPDAIREAVGDRPIIKLTLTLDGVETDWSNPSAPVRVSIPYALAEAEGGNPESIIVWYIDEQGNVTAMPDGYYRQANGAVSFSTTHFSDFAVAFNPVYFKDVPGGVWYSNAVSYAAARGITTGTGNGKFSPNNRLTRAQAITLIMRAYGIAPDTDLTDNFADAGNTGYAGYLAAAKRLGISKGTGNNMFAPDKVITRQEMFTLLFNALDAIRQLPSETVKPVKTLTDFADEEQVGSWAREAMTLLVETGIVNGKAGMLAPVDTTTRVEMVQVLYNLKMR